MRATISCLKQIPLYASRCICRVINNTFTNNSINKRAVISSTPIRIEIHELFIGTISTHFKTIIIHMTKYYYVEKDIFMLRY